MSDHLKLSDMNWTKFKESFYQAVIRVVILVELETFTIEL